MSPNSIQLADGRILRVANGNPQGYNCDAITDPITCKVFLAGSVKTEFLWGVLGDNWIYQVSLSSGSSTQWFQLPSGAELIGIRTAGDYLFVLDSTTLQSGKVKNSYIYKVQISTKEIVTSILLVANSSDALVPFDSNPTREMIYTESGEYIYEFDYNLSGGIVFYSRDKWGPSVYVYGGTCNSQYLFTQANRGDWNGNGGITFPGQGWPHGMLANETYVYVGGTKKTLTGGTVLSGGWGSKVFCFLENGDIVGSSGIYKPNGDLVKSLSLSSWSQLCSDERYCPAEA